MTSRSPQTSLTRWRAPVQRVWRAASAQALTPLGGVRSPRSPSLILYKILFILRFL
jgi:hypothetical protein